MHELWLLAQDTEAKLPWWKDYWPVWFATHENVKKAFDEAGITIPFAQRDVHLHTVR